ncbi:MAG TPA: type II toxin-antitoxin system PemK/MazF family toxin [Thermoanaerobaculia bacterium]|nr:type II toxin-antitoxin system PemK/MazF family toxin [Thermoanaerobaculia bacterium]
MSYTVCAIPQNSTLARRAFFVIVSRQAAIQSRLSSVICAPVYSSYHDLRSQVLVGIDEGLKHDSSIHCDELVSLPKSTLTDFVGSLGSSKTVELNYALLDAVGLTLEEPE